MMTPRGMSVQEAYRLYRDGSLLVNRKYQRKLVWTEDEKIYLIDTILCGYPIPLILLAERPHLYESKKYEILDGVQRFNAIFSFIENYFSINGKYFDVSEFARAKQLADQNIFQIADQNEPLLDKDQCANFLDYQLAVTIFPAHTDEQVTEIFSRINSSGRQLSNQERRQAGIIEPFGELVRNISAELRGDASQEVLLLSEMPEISISPTKSKQKYGIDIDDIFWVRQGILSSKGLREGEDEEMIADIAVSTLDFPLDVLNPFVSAFASDLRGVGTGTIRLKGKLKQLEMTGAVMAREASLKISFLQTRYSFSDSVRFSPAGIIFRDIRIYDERRNQGTINGMLSHRSFKDIGVSFDITMDRMQVLNTRPKDSDSFYGTAYASGYAGIRGHPA